MTAVTRAGARRVFDAYPAPSGQQAAAFDPLRLFSKSPMPFHRRAALLAARPLLSRLIDLPEYQRLYERARSARGTFCERASDVLGITVDLAAASETSVPQGGPLIVVANHPHGMLDGLALLELVRRSRRDVRVLTNDLLAAIPELTETCLFVHAFEQRAAGRTRAGLRAALGWLRDGHALIVFPAGAVAHQAWRRSSTPGDGPWRDTFARLALSSGARVVPAYITGRNREMFYRAGECHPSLRTALLARELLASRNSRVLVRLGRPLMPARHAIGVRKGPELTALLRAEVERLGDGTPHRRRRTPAAAPQPADLSADVDALAESCRLLHSGRFDVYCAPAAKLPAVLPEIGRLREIAFRSVGEGTGHAIDLDRFDAHYEHLFVWDREAQLIAGAYRLGPVDRIVAARGIDGLYTSTLYRYDAALIARLGPSIELGRSFVRADYQRSSNALLLLWKGIAQFVLRSPQYRVLFGPVSISARYSEMSRQLLQAFLLQNARHHELAELVTPVAPAAPVRIGADDLGDVQTLDRLIAGQEPDGKGIPVLLRQYLRLNARLLAFNIDHAFGDALDALMMVDLARVDRPILARYFGAEGANRFLPASAAQAEAQAA